MSTESVLRFITAGSVDDGKSTLIGRLLYDSQALMTDQLQSLYKGRYKRGEEGQPDFAQLTDGLAAEREQGITIDVAYRYFATPKRKFIIADTPGHEQYTRNMVTGASTADAAVLLLDATRLNFDAPKLALLPQTRRHSAILKLLEVEHIIVAVNKLDLLDYDESKFKAICEAYNRLAEHLEIADVHYVPISALNGDNIVNTSENMPWYTGSALLPLLESLPDNEKMQRQEDKPVVLPVQAVQRFDGQAADDFRGYQSRVVQGVVKPGIKVRVEPAGQTSEVKEVFGIRGEQSEARSGEVVTVTLKDDVDASRGDYIVDETSDLQPVRSLHASVCWFDSRPLNLARKYYLQQTNQTVFCKIKQIEHIWDPSTLERRTGATDLTTNDIARVQIALQKPILAEAYVDNPSLGAFILIDEATNNTVAAGIIKAE